MVFRLLHGEINVFKNFQFSSYSVKIIRFSSHTTGGGGWIQENKLFQRHSRLQLFEEQHNKSWHQLQQILAHVFVSGLHHNQFVMSRLLYASIVELKAHHAMDDLEVLGVKIFHQIRQPNIFSWNTMIRFFCAFSDVEKIIIAVHYYITMLRQGMLPDRYTFTFLIQACGACSDIALVDQAHGIILKFGFGYDLFVQNSLLHVYGVCGSIIEAQMLFDEMPVKDVVSWTSLIVGLVSQSECHKAILVFKRLISDDCLPSPNSATMVSVISACGNLGSVNHTKCMHALLEKSGWNKVEISVINSLIDAYAKCGNLCHAQKVFDDIYHMKRDLYSWTAIISGFAMHGRGLDCLHWFSNMQFVCTHVPDAVTFLVVLSGCAHSGLVEEGLCIFESMKEIYQIEPNLRHYGCIVDLLGRAGMLNQAYNIVESMPMGPNLAILGSLLSGCRLHNNLALGVAVLRKIEMLKEKGGSPVLLSNMYAHEHQWNNVIHIRKEMKEAVKEKHQGRSWIVVKD